MRRQAGKAGVEVELLSPSQNNMKESGIYNGNVTYLTPCSVPTATIIRHHPQRGVVSRVPVMVMSGIGFLRTATTFLALAPPLRGACLIVGSFSCATRAIVVE